MRYPSSVTFWGVLTVPERRAFAAVAHQLSFPRGALLIREGDLPDHVFVILGGRTKICVHEYGAELILAERGPGQLVGERAALELGVRSATVVALEPVEALVVPTEDFRAFLRTHPAVYSIVDGQNYGRLADGQRPGRSVLNGQNCTIVNTDVVGFSQPIRNDDHRRLVRQANLSMTMTAIDSIFGSCSIEDCGDGLLMVIRPDIPTQRVVECLVNALPPALRRHNDTYAQAVRIQLRIAIDVGPVVSDSVGVSGQAIIRTARLLDASDLKAAMAETGANLGIIVSEFVYDTAIRQADGPVDPARYIPVQANVKESSIPAWMQLIG
jgi:class 3 adenylate cyclase